MFLFYVRHFCLPAGFQPVSALHSSDQLVLCVFSFLSLHIFDFFPHLLSQSLLNEVRVEKAGKGHEERAVKSLLTYSGKNEKQKLLFTLTRSVLIRFGSSEDASHQTLLSVADRTKKLCSSNNKQQQTVWCSGAYAGLFVYSVALFKCTHSEKEK